MSVAAVETEIVKSFIGGKWKTIEASSYTPVYSPSRGETIARTPMSGAKEVDTAVEAAAKAFPSWANTPVMKRVQVLYKFRELLNSHFDELVQLVTKENGKTIEESKGDVRRGIEVVEFACGVPHMSKGETLPQIADELDASTTREPLGVCVGITPFNFPAMVPLWMFPIAIACGNTFVLKPSEKVPLSAVRLVQLLEESGLPEGVMNIVHGGREVVDALCTHPKVSSISFVGSTKIAHHVYSLGCSHGKRVQSAGGAKNVLMVMPDAEVDSTLRAIIGSAYGCAGQRCMAGSVLMGVGEAADKWRDHVVGALESLKVDDTIANPKAEMGPVIDAGSRDRVLSYIEKGGAEGAKLVRDGRKQKLPNGFFVGPTLIDNVQPNMSVFKDEIFGPVLSMLRPKTLEEGLKWMNSIQYGNGASIFTSSGSAARQFVREIQCGMLGVNVGVPAPMALFSFSGWNQSFFGDLHVQGMEGVMFYTRQKCVLSRWDSNYVRTHGW